MIPKLEAHPDVNEQVLIPVLEIPRSTTRSVNTSAVLEYPILNDPVLDDNNPVLQQRPKFIAKRMEKINGFGNSLLKYIPPKPKVVDEALASFKNLIKNCTTRQKFHYN